jgi:hypothetical protein
MCSGCLKDNNLSAMTKNKPGQYTTHNTKTQILHEICFLSFFVLFIFFEQYGQEIASANHFIN